MFPWNSPLTFIIPHRATFIVCKKCCKVYVGSTITSFRQRFNNNKSNAMRYDKGHKGIPGEQVYSNFFSNVHEGVNDMTVLIIIDKTDVREPTRREAFWAYKLN